MRQDLGLSTRDYATAVNAFLIAYGIMYLGSGVIIDRLGARTGLALFVGSWSIVSGCLPCLDSWPGQPRGIPLSAWRDGTRRLDGSGEDGL